MISGLVGLCGSRPGTISVRSSGACTVCHWGGTDQLVVVRLVVAHIDVHDDVMAENVFRIHDDFMKWKYYPRYWPLCGEFTVHR